MTRYIPVMWVAVPNRDIDMKNALTAGLVREELVWKRIKYHC